MQTAWAVPVVATIAAILMVGTYHNTTMLIGGPAIAFFGVAGALLARDLLDDATDTTLRTAMAIHTLVIDVIAFLALSAVYLNKMSSWISAPLVGLLSGLLILETFERGGLISQPTRVFYAIAGGAIMTEAMIMLNWWPTHGWTGGAVLLVAFYVVAGVLLERTRRTTLRSRDLVEFGLVSLVALAILALTA